MLDSTAVNISKTVSKRISSTKKYIDSLSSKYSKLNIIRVDLGYIKPHSDSVTLEDANKDLSHMFNNMRSKPSVFGDMVGYITKREYTEDKGVHLHCAFIYDGQKVIKDKYKGDQIGQYWNENITDNKGSYYNCNRGDYEYRGVGMLDHRDNEKRAIVDEVVEYMCKDEQSIKQEVDGKKSRAFTRGVAPKSKSVGGRKRK